MTIEEYMAAFVLGHILYSDLPDVATELLLAGYDSNALGALAGVTKQDSPRECLNLWSNALRELNIELPSRINAGQRLKGYYLSKVASGEISPRKGARKLLDLADSLNSDYLNRKYAGDGFGIEKLYGLYYSYDEYEISSEDIDSEIIKECSRLLKKEKNEA